MNVRVTIRRTNSDVPEDFVFSIVASVLGMDKEEFDRLKGKDGSISLYVRDPESILKLQQVSEKHSCLVEVSFESSSSGGGVFSLTNLAVKSNWGLAVSWIVAVVVLGILSLVPVLGFVVSFLLGSFVYGFVLYFADEVSSSDAEVKIEEVVGNMSLKRVYSEYMGAGFGFTLSYTLLTLGIVVVTVVLFMVFGMLGAISDLVAYGRAGGGLATSLMVVVLLYLMAILWVLYSLPLVVAKCVEGGSINFEKAFKSVIKVPTPSFVRESFSNQYIKLGGLWLFVITVVTVVIALLFALIITIPVALLAFYWLQVYLALSAVSYIRS